MNVYYEFNTSSRISEVMELCRLTCVPRADIGGRAEEA